MQASIKNLRLHTAEVLAAAERGEEVVITYHGKPRALLTRWSKPAKRKGPNPAFGLWRDRTGDVDETVRELRQGRNLP